MSLLNLPFYISSSDFFCCEGIFILRGSCGFSDLSNALGSGAFKGPAGFAEFPSFSLVFSPGDLFSTGENGFLPMLLFYIDLCFFFDFLLKF